MAKLIWDQSGERLYQTGVSHGVLFPIKAGVAQQGVAWNGLTSVSESPSGAEITKLYADNQTYATLTSAEEFAGTIEAYMSPVEFDQCDGSAALAEGVSIGQQPRLPFGFSWRTEIGNDTEGTEHGYIINVVFLCKAKPSSRDYSTMNDSPEASTLSWEFESEKVQVPGYAPSAIVRIDSTKVSETGLKAVETLLYGDETTEPMLPTPEELLQAVGA